MAYTPDPTDASQPTGDVYAATAAPEFRALKGRVNDLAAGTGVQYTVGGSPLSGHTAVAVNSSGLLIYADPTSAAQLGNIVGVLADAYGAGTIATVNNDGVIIHAGWTWSSGPIYAGLAGALTQTPPSGVFTQVVGYALAATRMRVFVQPSIIQ